MTCGKKILLGLAIGAGAGAAYGVALKVHGVEEAGSIAAATTILFGGVGSLIGYRLCR